MLCCVMISNLKNAARILVTDIQVLDGIKLKIIVFYNREFVFITNLV